MELELFSAKMRSLADLLATKGRLHVGAIELQLTAQSQLLVRHHRRRPESSSSSALESEHVSAVPYKRSKDATS